MVSVRRAPLKTGVQYVKTEVEELVMLRLVWTCAHSAWALRGKER